MPRPIPLTATALVLAAAACVPADHALPLGSVSFNVHASRTTASGLPAASFIDRWSVQTNYAVLSFKTMTVGEIADPDKCAYRGRGADNNVVFDARSGIVQTFNGLLPSSCPDVGVVLGPPDGNTALGPGTTSNRIIELASAPPAHAAIEVTARRRDETYVVTLRFPTALTSSRFGGCRARTRGVEIEPQGRDDVSVAFSIEPFFREGLGITGALRFAPFVDADVDHDHHVTMDELDGIYLSSLRAEYSDLYQVPGEPNATFAVFVREQFKSVFFFRDDGQCNGNDPGSE